MATNANPPTAATTSTTTTTPSGPHALVPGKVQKVSAFDGDVVTLELFAGRKVLVWIEPGRVRVLDDVDARPRRSADDDAPAVQGLLRKELIPAILTAVDDDLGRFVFARKDAPPRTLIVERDGKDPRWVLTGPAAPAKKKGGQNDNEDDGDGERILASGPQTRAKDGRDLRRGRRYEPPRTAPAPMPEPMSTSTPAAIAAPQASPAQAARKQVKTEIAREERKVQALLRDRSKHGVADVLEHEGELLKTVLGRLRRGQDAVDVFDFDGTPRTLTLDPTRDAKENLALRFARAKKARAAIAHTAPRLAETEARLVALRALLARLERDAFDNVLAADVSDTLAAYGPGARRKAALQTAAAQHKSGTGRLPWRSFAVGDGARGVVVRVGKGAKDNDALVKAARGNDLWFHARDATGAHVVVASDGGPVRDDVVRDAALLAVWFSTKRGEKAVVVQSTRVKHLKKPGAGAPAGLWLVGQEETRVVKEDAARIQALLLREVASTSAG